MKRILFIIAALFATAQSQTIQTIGAPTTTVVSRGNFRTDSIFYLPKRQKLPTDSGAVRYQISDSSVYYWSGFQWRRLGVHIDTASMLNPYLRGSGTANYFPKFDASRSVINSKLFESGTNLLFNTTTASFTSTGISTIEANNTSASVFALKVLDTTRSYIASNSSNTMDINNLRAGDIRFYTNAQLRGRFQTDGTFRLNSLTGTGSRIVTADADGVLSATSSATGLVDTLVLSTRAWRQKGDDSLGAIIATKGSGTVTSVATGYGLSGGTITTTGTIIVDSAIVASRLRVGKVVDSLALVKQNVLTNPVTGTGTTNYVPKFTGTSTIGNSLIRDNGTNVGIDVSPSYKLDVNGTFRSTGNTIVPGWTFQTDGIQLARDSGSLIVFRRTTDNAGNFSIIPARYQGFDVLRFRNSGGGESAFWLSNGRLSFAGGTTESMTLIGSELFVGHSGSPTDAGDYKLQVSGNAYVTSSVLLAATSGNVGIGLVAAGQSGFKTLELGGTGVSGLIDVYQGTSRQLRIYNSSSDSYLANITNGGAMYLRTTTSGGTQNDNIAITSAGNVGIGTTSPNFKLDVNGTFNVRSNYAYFGSDANTAVYAGSFSNEGRIGVGGRSSFPTANLTFFTADGTNNFERMRISSSGEVLVNTVSDAGDYKLQVSGNAYVTGTTVLAATSGNVGIGTASPSASYLLDVIGKERIFNTSGQSLLLSGATTATMYQQFNTSGGNHYIGVASSTGTGLLGGVNAYSFNILTESARDISFGTTNTEKIRIHSDGGLMFKGQSAAPTAIAGTVYYDTDDNKLKVYNGTTWVDLH